MHLCGDLNVEIKKKNQDNQSLGILLDGPLLKRRLRMKR